ncbi:MAG: hypothetical protein GY749_06355 [Desulfobacteraceae bacterium]|nr:hypothetical protein [Desulfobacteraceae bacterium]
MAALQSVLTFDGKDDYVEVPYAPQLNPDQFFVLSCWVKVQGGQGTYRSVFTSRDDVPTKGYMLYANSSNKWQFSIGTQTGWVSIIGPDIVLNTWTHVAVVYDSQGVEYDDDTSYHQMALFVNGKLASGGKGNCVPNTQRPLRIGTGATEGSPRYFFAGQITQVRFWNSIYGETSAYEYGAHRDMNRDSSYNMYPSAHWPLNKGDGNIAIDAGFPDTDAGFPDESADGKIYGAVWEQQDTEPVPYFASYSITVRNNSSIDIKVSGDPNWDDQQLFAGSRPINIPVLLAKGSSVELNSEWYEMGVCFEDSDFYMSISTKSEMGNMGISDDYEPSEQKIKLKIISQTEKSITLELEDMKSDEKKVEITNILCHGEVKRVQSDEYIEIANKGTGDADMSGWRVTSSGRGQDFTFPEGAALQPGKSFRIYTNEVHAEWGGFSFGSKTAIWNDKGDVGILYDADGKEISKFSYGDKA